MARSIDRLLVSGQAYSNVRLLHRCLAHLNHPTSCPLCRKAFGIDRVKKLHVDRHVPAAREAAMPGAWSLVQRLARCVRSDVDIQTTEDLIREGRQWLDADNHKELVQPFFLATLH